VIPAAQVFETTQTYSCGCIDRWPLYGPPDEADTMLDVPCVPEHCDTCERVGLCTTRKAMPPAYTPVQWNDLAVGGPKKYRRL
jgi:hypothetical protein